MTQDARSAPRPEDIPVNLNERQRLQGVTFQRIAPDRLLELTKPLAPKGLKLNQSPVLELSSRHPFEENLGRIDVLEPGRWDTESNLIFMMPIVTGPSVGEWDGSVIYGMFNAPAGGNYLIVGNFSGYDTTMKLSGPWGTTTAYTAQTSDVGVVTAIWNGSGSLFYTMSCSGQGLGYVESIQVFLLS